MLVLEMKDRNKFTFANISFCVKGLVSVDKEVIMGISSSILPDQSSIFLSYRKLRAREEITSHVESRCIPAGGVVKTRQMKDIPAFSRLAGRAPQLPTWRTYFCANPKFHIHLFTWN
jgi:hypothetical protein